MKLTTIAASMLAVTLAIGTGAAYAQFGMPKLPGTGGSDSGGSSVKAADVAKNARNAVYSFALANHGLLKALGNYNDFAANQQMLDSLKTGDAAANKDDMEKIVNLAKSSQDSLKARIGENAKLDAEQKKLAAASTLEYVKGLASSKKLVSSLQDVTKNPASLGMDAGVLMYAAKEMPSIVSTGATTTNTLFNYLGTNGVDLKDAKQAAKDLGT